MQAESDYAGGVNFEVLFYEYERDYQGNDHKNHPVLVLLIVEEAKYLSLNIHVRYRYCWLFLSINDL